MLIACAAALAAGGLTLAGLAGAHKQPTVRAGAYGPNTCDSDTQVADTKITKAPDKKTKKSKAKIEFEGFYCNSPDDPVDQSLFDFSCKLDKEKAKSCTSPVKYKGLKKGKHKFTVAANVSGSQPQYADPTPAKAKWKVKH